VPASLQDLLKDPRFPGTRRHLRKIFVDPVTGGTEWGIVYQGDKVGVLAVYSLSQARPLKVANFDARFPHFENREHLSEWKFSAAEGVSPAPAAAPPEAPADAPEPEPAPEPAPAPATQEEPEDGKETAPPTPRYRLGHLITWRGA
jgi:hypothetical protein